MINKLIKEIGFICLCFVSLALTGCFHVPDEDWLLSRNKIETGSLEKNDEINQAFNGFIDDFNDISDQRNEMKNENVSVGDENLEKISAETGDNIINDEHITNDESSVQSTETEFLEKEI